MIGISGERLKKVMSSLQVEVFSTQDSTKGCHRNRFSKANKLSTVEAEVRNFCGELVSATTGSECVREKVVVGGLGGYTDEDVEILGDT